MWLIGIALADVGNIRGYPDYGFLQGLPCERTHLEKIPVTRTVST